MDGVERLTQMNEVERMREVMDVLSDNMRKQNDKDRMEMLAMLASTTAMEANLMSMKFAHSANTDSTGAKTTKQKEQALMREVEQAESDKDKAKSSTQANKQNQNLKQQPNQLQQVPASTLATRTQQALNKKKRLAGRGTLSAVGTLGAV